MLNRRNFIRNTAITTLATLSIPELVTTTFAAEKVKKIQLQKDDIILFQGDSITDWGRNHTETKPNNTSMLGSGYTLIAATHLLTQYPKNKFQIYNRGVSGNKVFQLAERWDAECLNFKPNVLSIMVGVNDFWHTLTNGYTGTINTYRDDYKKLIDRTKQALPDVKLILGEPFLAKGVRPEEKNWYPKFNEYRLVAREVADTYHATFIPYQSIMDDAQKLVPGTYWTSDGVHPTVAGAGLMAQAWLETVKA